MKPRRSPLTRPITQLGAGRERGVEGSGMALRSIVGDFGSKTVSVVDMVGSRLTERQFQRIVRQGLEDRGFVVTVIPDMRKTTAGWPDLTAWHPKIPGRLWCLELKTMTGRATVKQALTLRHLAGVSGIVTRLVRPSDWPRLRDEIDEALTDSGTGDGAEGG